MFKCARLPMVLPLAAFVIIASFLPLSALEVGAPSLKQVCRPSVSKPTTVDSHDQVVAGGLRAEPPVTDTDNGFAWPDTAMGVIKTAEGYEFFSSDGGLHTRTEWGGQPVGNNDYGSVVTTTGTLDNPLGTGIPRDVTISPNPDPAVNPGYSGYTYIGGGPVYRVPPGLPGAGNLLLGYHAELPNDALYAVHGLAASWDNGLHWMDLGEVVRPNQSYAPLLSGFDEIGDGPLLVSPDGNYFYFYFPEWPAGAPGSTTISVARAPVRSVLEAAFGTQRVPTAAIRRPHTVQFEKYWQGSWNLQPGIGGASTNLIPNSPYAGYLDVHYDSDLHRYVLITSDDTSFAYAESVDGLTWTTPTLLGSYGPLAAYPTSVGLGDDPSILGKQFYTYFTYLNPDNTNLRELKRLTVTCP